MPTSSPMRVRIAEDTRGADRTFTGGGRTSRSCRVHERAAAPHLRRDFGSGAAALRPGVKGFEVDAAARKVVEAGYPEFKHGLGHGLGRAVHDGGTLLGPRWPCYGRNTEAVVEAANVFTLELGVPTSAGLVGLEEDVLVTAAGCEFLSSRQREIVLV